MTGLKTKAGYAIQLAKHLALHPDDLRHVPAWRRYLRPSPLESRVPWLAFNTVEYLQHCVRPGSRVFEFGGGGSTAWFADQGCEVSTIEHDPVWAQMIAAAVPTAMVHEVPDSPAYPASIDDSENASLDLVLVDGVRRVECVRHALKKVRSGGALVVDDVDRPEYAEIFHMAADWACTSFEGLSAGKAVPGYTAIFTRP